MNPTRLNPIDLGTPTNNLKPSPELLQLLEEDGTDATVKPIEGGYIDSFIVDAEANQTPPAQSAELLQGCENPEDAALVQVPRPSAGHVCSFNVCANGHKWNPAVSVASCPGCNSPVLAVRMEQCPICNEPTETFALRSDHLNERGMIVSALCQKKSSMAEITQIVMERQHAEVAEADIRKRNET